MWRSSFCPKKPNKLASSFDFGFDGGFTPAISLKKMLNIIRQPKFGDPEKFPRTDPIGAPEQPRKRPQVPSEQIVGPKKRWVDHAPVPSSVRPEIPATVLDSPENEAQLRDDDKERSPRRSQDNGGNDTKKNERKKTIDPEVILRKESGPWSLFNFGGQGDCAFRAVAGSISKAQGKDLPSEVIVREASRLRVLAVVHILKHKDREVEKWAPDSDEPEIFRANQAPPSEFSDYCMIASLQGCYADGLLLHSLAERLATTIIVFSWNSSANIWQRSVLSPSFTGGSAQSPKKGMQPVVIAFRDRHYQAFCPDNKDVVFPSAWLAETELKDRTFFRGGGSALTGSLPHNDRLLLPRQVVPTSV